MYDKEQHSIQFSPPDIGVNEINETINTLQSGWITSGPKKKELENRLAKYCGTNKVICLSSATAAEELNLRILGVGPGDEVIVPAYTYTATASAVIHCGARVVFVDSVRDGSPATHSPEMDYDAMEAAVTERTKAVIPVDIAGVPCDYDRIFDVVEKTRNLFHPNGKLQEQLGRVAVVSDCAHSLGAVLNGKPTGSLADFSSFSFHAVKNLTTAEGGAATWNIPGIDNEQIYNTYNLYSLHGQSKDAFEKNRLGEWEYDIIGPWYKCNMTDIMAGIGLAQMDRYPELLKIRRGIIKKYDSVMDRGGISHLKHFGDNWQSSGHLYIVRIPGIGEEKRNALIEALAKRSISTNVHYKPLPMMTAYKNLGWNIRDFPNAYDYYRNLITLPLHTKLTDEDVEYVMDVFTDVVRAGI